MRTKALIALCGTTVLTGILGSWAPPAYAQEKKAPEADDGVPDIIVTARRRAESEQSVPISMTVLSGPALDVRGIKSLADIAQFTPNLTFDTGARSQGGSLSSSVFIRGVGQADFSALAEPGVGIYIDGVYFGRSLGSILESLDLDHVEVLRGPQGTLFGRNTIGGAISVVSKMPSQDLNESFTAGYGRFNEWLLRGSISGPLSKTFSVRLSGSFRKRDGYERSLFSGIDENNVNTLSGRFIGRWTPSDSFTATTIIDGNRQRQNGQAQHIIAINPTLGALGLYNNIVVPTMTYGLIDSRYITAGQRFNYANDRLAAGSNRNNLDAFGLSETLEWKLAPAVTLTSITAYRELKGNNGTDVDGTPYNFQEAQIILRQHQFSQELRLNGSSLGGKLDWLLGAYYFKEHFTELQQQRLFPALFQLTGNVNFDSATDQLMVADNKSLAGYADATLRITDQLSLTGGIRYTHDEKVVVGQSRTIGLGRFLLPAGSTLRPSWSAWTPKASLDFKPSKDVLLYASIAKGFKGGGVNATVTKPTDFQVYNPERQTAIEVGIKSDWFDRRLRVNIAAFTSRYDGLQLRATLLPGQLTCPAGLVSACQTIVNAAETRIKGVESEIIAEPVRHLNLFAGIGYISQRFTKIDPILLAANVLNYSRQIPKTPEWSVDLGAQADFAIGGAGSLTMRVDYAYRSSVFLDIENNPEVVQPGFGLLNARIAFKTSDDRWEFAVSGQNLTDRTYITSGFSGVRSLGYSAVAYGAPRTWTATIKYAFGR